MEKEKLSFGWRLWNSAWVVVLVLTILSSIGVFYLSADSPPLRILSIITGTIATFYQVYRKRNELAPMLRRQEFITRKFINGAATWIVNRDRENFEEITEKQTSKIESIILQKTQQDDFRQRLMYVLEKRVHAHLYSTVYSLDKIALSLEVSEVLDAVTKFQVYRLDEQTPTTESYRGTFEGAFNSQDRRVLLTGAGGAGKSTTLAMFAKQLIEQRL